MDPGRPHFESDRDTLIRRLDQARERIALGAVELRGDLDVGARVRTSFAHSPIRWIGGAAATGLALMLFRRGRKPRRAAKASPLASAPAAASGFRGLLPDLLKFLLPLLKPALAALVAQQVARRSRRDREGF